MADEQYPEVNEPTDETQDETESGTLRHDSSKVVRTPQIDIDEARAFMERVLQTLQDIRDDASETLAEVRELRSMVTWMRSQLGIAPQGPKPKAKKSRKAAKRSKAR